MAFVDNTFSFEEFDLEDEIDETQPAIDETVIDETQPVVDETVIDETQPVVDETVIDETQPAIDETDETMIDETELPDLVGSLAEKISSNLGPEIEEAVRDATKLLGLLRTKQRAIKKKEKKAAVVQKPRAKYGQGIPTAGQLFAKANRSFAVTWYSNGGRIADFNPAKAQQISKYLAIMWKELPSASRAEFDDMRNGIIAQKEEAIAAAAGVPIAM
ncbi:hypothetical protein ENVG_00212 [Emiliania huxleyi virus 84]|nr:hypothetical protein ENVG_00212 [Emiliania huxleyi virus 84]